MVVGWDELTDEERPPKHIWTDGSKLRAWFDDIKDKRRRDDRSAEIEDPVQNELAEDLRRGREP